MIRTKYIINEFHANLNPNIDDIEFVMTSVSIEYGEADFEEDSNRFITDSTIELEFYDTDDESKEDPDPEFGTVSIDATMVYEHEDGRLGDDFNLKEETEIWNEEGHKAVDEQLITQLEVEILPKVFSPIEQLLEDSFIGLLPRYRFSLTEEEERKMNEEQQENGDQE